MTWYDRLFGFKPGKRLNYEEWGKYPGPNGIPEGGGPPQHGFPRFLNRMKKTAISAGQALSHPLKVAKDAVVNPFARRAETNQIKQLENFIDVADDLPEADSPSSSAKRGKSPAISSPRSLASKLNPAAALTQKFLPKNPWKKSDPKSASSSPARASSPGGSPRAPTVDRLAPTISNDFNPEPLVQQVIAQQEKTEEDVDSDGVYSPASRSTATILRRDNSNMQRQGTVEVPTKQKSESSEEGIYMVPK